MFSSYFKTALRSLTKKKMFSILNIAGLSIGMAACLVIYLYVQKELSFDQFHEKSDRIYRVLTIDKALGVNNTLVGISIPALAPTIKEELPEVLDAVRIFQQGRQGVEYNELRFYADNFAYTEPSFFSIFDFKLEVGDSATAISEPNTAVITRKMARKIYGDENPVGKTFKDLRGVEITITGIMEEIPENSHLQFDIVASFIQSDPNSQFGRVLESWGRISVPTYIELDRQESIKGIDARMVDIMRKNDVGENFLMTTQPLSDSHLRSEEILFDRHNNAKGSAGYVYSLSAVAFIIIMIAAFNFMNLSTAQSASRAREVGMRKVVGARKTQLIGQFLGESLIVSFVSIIFAICLVIAVGRFLEVSYDLSLNLVILTQPIYILGLIIVTAFIGLMSGLYPAIVLSGFKPVEVLKGSFKTTGQGILLRRVLVSFQFAVSIMMIIGSGIVFNQIDYILSKDIGFNREQILNIRVSRDMLESYDAFAEQLAGNSSIISIAASTNVPGRQLGRTGLNPEGAADDDSWILSRLGVDDNFFETLEMKIVDGRNFSREFGTDSSNVVILNEAAINALNWDDPIGKTFNDGSLTVIGIVNDFHFASLRHQVEPLAIFFQEGANGNLSLRIGVDEMSSAINSIENTWKEFYPGYPFEYTFLDLEFAQNYKTETNFSEMARAFTYLAIFIACLGLFGLSSHTIQQRAKEIGIRKVFGASISGLVMQLSREFMFLVLISNFIAWPVTYYIMNGWLEEFAYRTSISPWVFLLSSITAVVIAFGTVSIQAVRASTANPIDSLHYE